MSRKEEKVFASSAPADALYSDIVEQVSPEFDRVETDYSRRMVSFQRQFQFPGQWTDITNLEIVVEVQGTPRGSTLHFTSYVQTNNLMNNTPWQVSHFMGDFAKAIENIARNAVPSY